MSLELTWHSLAKRPPGQPPVVMAHRGASDELPENTLAAFERALAQGAAVLETDLRFTRDDELVLMHDATVDRTMQGSGAVAELTLADVKKFRARAATPSDEPVPTLGELLEFTRAQRIPLALELKDDRFLDTRAAGRLIELLARQDALDRVVLVSFNLQRLQTCKQVAPAIPIGMITLKNPLPLYSTELLGPFFPLLYLNPLYIRWARRLGKIVCPLDPSPEPRLGYYLRLGAPVIMTNHPAQTIAALGRILL